MPKRRKPYTRHPAPVAQNQPVAMDAGLALRRAADKARESMTPKSYLLSAPVLPKGVVPDGEKPAVAMDSCADIYAYAQQGCNGAGFQPFPGYPYLAQLATRPEYRAFADAMAGELTREWISFDGANGGDDDAQSDANQDNERIEELTKAIDRLGLKNVFKLAAQHDCFFGRAQIAITLKNQDPGLPLVLSPNTVPKGSLERFSCVEPMWSTPNEYNAIDPTAPDFYKPRSWFVLGKKYHASRLLTIISRPLPDMLKPAYNFSGMSLSQLAERYVDNWLRTRQSISDLVNNFSITALKTNMQNVLTGGCDGSDIAARADLFTLYRSNKGLMLLDNEGEELVQLNTPLSGLSDLQGQALEQLCVVSRMPAMVLTGISPSGLNASSEGEIRVFYDWISSQQESVWKEALDTCIKVIQLDLWGEIDPTITWKYNPLWQVTAKEQSEIRLNNANADATYVDRGILSPEEVRERLSADPESDYAGIDVSEVPFVDEGADPLDGLDPNGAFVAQDADRWITVKPNGPDAKGRPALIGEGGEIKSGMGGKFNGQKIDNLKGSNEKPKEMSTHEAAQAAGVKGIREGMKHEALERKVRAHLAGQRGAALIAAGKNTDLPQYKGVTEEAAKGLAEVVSEYQYSVNTSNWELDARGMKGIEKLVAGGVLKPGNDRYIHEMTQAGKEIAQKILRNPVSKVSIEDALKEISKS